MPRAHYRRSLPGGVPLIGCSQPHRPYCFVPAPAGNATPSAPSTRPPLLRHAWGEAPAKAIRGECLVVGECRSWSPARWPKLAGVWGPELAPTAEVPACGARPSTTE